MRPPILISYAWVRELRGLLDSVTALLQERATDVMFDSGAFTAHHRGYRISLEEYENFCYRADKLDSPALWGYLQLDVIGNRVATQANLAHHVAAGLRPMPILTVDADVENVQELVAISPTRRIAVAGSFARFENARAWTFNRYVRAREIIGDGAQIHGLAYVRSPEMFDAKLASVDSSKHSSGGRYGSVSWFDVAAMRSRTWRTSQGAQPPVWFDGFARRCGVTNIDMKRRDFLRGCRSFAWMSSAYSHIMMAQVGRRRGCLVFAAVSDYWDILILGAIAVHGRADGSGFDYHAVRDILYENYPNTARRVERGIVLLKQASALHGSYEA